MKRRFSDEFRASAVAALTAAGYPETKGALTNVSGSLGVSAANISRWFKEERNPPPDNLVNEKKDDISALIRKEIYGILSEMELKRDGATYRDLSTALGIATDKLQLLIGQPTENNKTTVVIEHVDT